MGVFGWVSWADFWFSWANIGLFGWLTNLLSQALGSQKCPLARPRLNHQVGVSSGARPRSAFFVCLLTAPTPPLLGLTIQSLHRHCRSPPHAPLSHTTQAESEPEVALSPPNSPQLCLLLPHIPWRPPRPSPVPRTPTVSHPTPSTHRSCGSSRRSAPPREAAMAVAAPSSWPSASLSCRSSPWHAGPRI